jgi:hypothetical protein
MESCSGTFIPVVSRENQRPGGSLTNRVTGCLALLIFATIDLVSWAWATLTIYHAWQVGFSNHIANLTSTIAMCFFAFAVPFGYEPKIAHFRPAYVIGLFSLFEKPKNEQLMLLKGPWREHRENSSLIRECLDSGRPELVKEALDSHNSDAELRENDFIHFMILEGRMKQPLLLGFDPNIPNSAGRTALLSAIARLRDKSDIFRFTDLFQLTVQVDPRLRKPIDVHFKDQQGFDAISCVLTGTRDSSRSFTNTLDLDPDTLYQFIEKLVQEGAFLPSLGFKSYRDFLQAHTDRWNILNLQTNPETTIPAATSALGEFVGSHLNDNNQLVRLTASILHPTPLRNLSKNLLPHAHKLVSLSLRIEALWKTEGQKFVVPYKNIVTVAFGAIRQEFPQGKSTDSSHRENSPIIQIIAEYLCSEPFDSSQKIL